ncbi:O-methyltransferase [Streptomyces purpurogeneiscleroticus]|uniref:O-methyltransferase n=1 Tax=Streptomyces purpurogeneiscleroticus TaxID=68259 RepID=UPI001CBEDB56|nr:class I SAM-dependent methyltransferase [Streptomyces purpurogeneiscleroticus]MBZ4016625.1 SAM-dependent methyltransferase [Streptomyces purpurogeneiscleroticus]
MTRATPLLDAGLSTYALEHSSPEDPLLRELSEQTARALGPTAVMQIGADQGTFMTLLAQATGAQYALEVGTFTGYSALCLARGLAGPAPRLICCDISKDYTDIGRPYWERAGVADRIDLRIAPALDTLRSLAPDPFLDLSFIDADKGSYIDYWNEIVPRTRPGGLILVDNTFAYGGVLDPTDPGLARPGCDPAAVHAFNAHAVHDPRVDLVMLPICDGLTLARK